MKTRNFLLMFVIICVMCLPVFAEIGNVADPTASDLVEETISIVQGISKHGFGKWFSENWYSFILMLVGIFSIVATVTPNESDNKILKYILKGINFLGGNVGKAKNISDILKKKI